MLDLRDAVVKGDVNDNTIEKRIILPWSFIGSLRYMIENYQDVIIIGRYFRDHNLFIIFTYNA